MSMGGGGSPCGFGRSSVRSPHQYEGSGLTGMPRYSSRIVNEYGVAGVGGDAMTSTPGRSPEIGCAQSGDAASPPRRGESPNASYCPVRSRSTDRIGVESPARVTTWPMVSVTRAGSVWVTWDAASMRSASGPLGVRASRTTRPASVRQVLARPTCTASLAADDT